MEKNCRILLGYLDLLGGKLFSNLDMLSPTAKYQCKLITEDGPRTVDEELEKLHYKGYGYKEVR